MRFLAIFVCVLCLSFPAFAQSKIGVVDVVLILNESKAAKDVEAQRNVLREQFLKTISESEQELRKEEKELLELRGDLVQEEYAQKRRDYEAKLLETRKLAQSKKRELDQASNAAMNILRDELTLIVQTIANERDYDLVISNKNVIAGQKSLDITDETLKRLNAKIKKIPLALKDGE